MSEHQDIPGRKRSMTSLALKWIAERIRKAELIKQAVQSGSYQVDSQKIAVSLLNPSSDQKE